MVFELLCKSVYLCINDTLPENFQQGCSAIAVSSTPQDSQKNEHTFDQRSPSHPAPKTSILTRIPKPASHHQSPNTPPIPPNTPPIPPLPPSTPQSPRPLSLSRSRSSKLLAASPSLHPPPLGPNPPSPPSIDARVSRRSSHPH